MESLPPWADLDRTARAARFFWDNRLQMGTALALGSMVTCCAVPRGAELLAATGGLDRPLRRVHETAQFVLSVVRPVPDAAAIAQVRRTHDRVRLKHGERFGGAIDDEDQLGALMLFSAYVLHLLPRLGVRPSEREAEDYLHLWCVVGAMLGIPEEMLPANFGEATRLCEVMEERHIGPSAAGVALTRRLIDGYRSVLGPFGGAVVPALRHLLPPVVAASVGLVPARWDVRFRPRVRVRGLEHALFDWFLVRAAAA